MSDLDRPTRPSVGLVGDLDGATIDQAKALVHDVLRDHPTAISIDLGLVTFFGAAGVRLVVDLLNQGVAVELVDATPHIRKVMGIFGLDRHPWLTWRDS